MYRFARTHIQVVTDNDEDRQRIELTILRMTVSKRTYLYRRPRDWVCDRSKWSFLVHNLCCRLDIKEEIKPTFH